MTKEEKKAIVYIKKDLEKAEYLDLQIVNTDRISIEKTLKLIEKQQKALGNSVPKEAIREKIEYYKKQNNELDDFTCEIDVLEELLEE